MLHDFQANIFKLRFITGGHADLCYILYIYIKIKAEENSLAYLDELKL